jgi:hypothetical protein
VSVSTVQLAGSRRLYDLADEVRAERELWRVRRIRVELDHIARQLEEAARAAITASDVWADAWAEAGVITLRRYIAQRKLIEHVT